MSGLLTPRFFMLLKEDETSELQKLLDDADFMDYMIDNDQLSLAFVQVILLNNRPMLDVLIKHGVDINTLDSMFMENGIMQAARYGHKEMMLHLIKLGVHVNHQSENGSTALHIAIENVKHNFLELLVQQPGIDLNIKDCSGFSPLLWTARLRDWRAMKIMIDAGCNIESKDFTKGVNSLHIVVDKNQAFWKGKLATLEDNNKCIELLLKSGVDIDAGDVYKNTPLLYAIRCNNHNAVKKLLKMNCKFIASRRVGSAFASTQFYFNPDLVGCDLTLFPLYVAMSKLQTKTVKMLCLAGIKYHKLANEKRILDFMSSTYEPLGEMLTDLVYHPMSLKQACRCAIRQSLSYNIEDLRSADLGLPAILVSYICLDDLDEL
ncbi:EHMT2-like protein [Mya arenaria]|uniref:EHMT2-like protein n=1 Tax=Mya arenaria TaxID=6604 RepID=A0ABY7EZA3_MYAAR|nr:EHMT2-like protein [Mya arenaria]